jgi:hypothetical protein
MMEEGDNMSIETTLFKGVVRGKTIELDHEPGLPDGQQVMVRVQPSVDASPGEGIRRSAGAWAQDADELDRFLEWNRTQRKQTRGGIGA